MSKPKRENLKALNVQINEDVYYDLDWLTVKTGESKAVLTEKALKEYIDEKRSSMKKTAKAASNMIQEVSFLKPSANKKVISEVKVSVMGTERSPVIRFAFSADALDTLFGPFPTDYISVSEVDENSKTIYFDAAEKGEGFKIDKREYGGTITIGNRWFAQNIIKYGWAGEYSLDVSTKGYWCINKQGED